MGNRDYRKREPKKPKRNAAKPTDIAIISPSTTVKLVKPKRKKKEELEE